MTNGDRIREMAITNEGLAALIDEYVSCDDCPCLPCMGPCKDVVLEWLDQDSLKPCPFCGDEDIQENIECNHVWLECPTCGGRTMPCISYKIAATRWNRRAGNAD